MSKVSKLCTRIYYPIITDHRDVRRVGSNTALDYLSFQKHGHFNVQCPSITDKVLIICESNYLLSSFQAKASSPF